MTSGYRVYRHKGWYHVYYNQCNSSPSGLGQWSISEIPKHPRTYKLWLENTRRKLDHSFATLSEKYPESLDTYGSKDSYYITRVQPLNTSRIQWIWEIDCDNEIMHVDSRPFFNLGNIPRGDLFFSSILLDNYGHRSCSPALPHPHRYNWKTKPHVSSASLDRYAEMLPAEKVLSPRRLLGLPPRTGSCEHVRRSLYQTMIGAAMRTQALSHDIPLLEQATSPMEITDNLVEFGRAMLHIALQPMIFCKFVYHLSQPVTCSQDRFQWMRPDVCVQYATHLDEEDVLKACIASLVSAVEEAPGLPPVTYAIAFSLTHISIARVSRSSTGAINTVHTPALEFLPSFFATTPSTPGISALIALSMTLGNSHILPEQPTHPARKIVELPVEVWCQIATYLSSCSDLKALAVLSRQSRSAVQDMLRYPHIAGHRLLKVLPDPLDALWVAPRWCRAVQEGYLPQEGIQSLYSQRFSASCGDDFDLEIQVAPGDPPLRPLTRSWSERASTIAGFVKEGQFDLIPVDGIHKSGWTVKYGISPAKVLE